MIYIYFGTPEFSAIILEKLIDSRMSPVALVCNPDRPMGRKMIITPPPTKEMVLRKRLLAIDILQPEKINEEFLNKLKSYEADFFVVAAYAKILPNSLLTIPRLGAIGVHPSLLPKLRGASPIQSAILDGDTQTGVTLYLLDEKVDHGPILNCAVYGMPAPHAYVNLSDILARLASSLLVKILPDFVEGKITPERQNDTEATFTRKFSTEDGYIDLTNLKTAIAGGSLELANIFDRKIKALNPDPGVYTLVNEKRMKLLSSKVDEGKLILEMVQMEGKKPTSFSQYQAFLS